MAYASGFEHDVFISYAQVDNDRMNLSGQEIQWVSYFREQLEKRVNQALGRRDKAEFWMDLTGLQKNEPVTAKIAETIEKSAALVVVLSRGYLESEWCRKEIAEFRKRMESGRGPRNRIFIVEFNPIAYEKRPLQFHDLLDYDFFDPDTKAELPPSHPHFSTKLFELRENLAACLDQFAEEPPDSPAGAEEPDDSKPAVYLAEGTPDLDKDRDQLSIYIGKLGYRVLPDRFYERAAVAFEEEARRDLKQAKLFVQLLGPVGSRRTAELPGGYEGLQVEIAGGLPKLRAYFRQQINFEDLDQEHRKMLEAPDVIASELSDFQRLIGRKLEEIELEESRKGEARSEGGGEKSVYIRSVGGDLAAAKKIRDCLKPFQFGYEILGEDDPIERLAEAEDPDGLVIVFGPSANPAWVKSSASLFKFLRLDRRPREPACAIFLDPPDRENDLLSEPRFFHTIPSGNGSGALDKFAEEIRSRPPV